MRAGGYILHVEDDDIDAELVTRAFGSRGVTVRRERAAAGAVELLLNPEAPLPALVLLDWNLPALSGAEFLAQLREHPSLCVLPVVVLSGQQDSEALLECYRRGASAYIRKPDEESGYHHLAQCLIDFWLGSVVLPAEVPA